MSRTLDCAQVSLPDQMPHTHTPSQYPCSFLYGFIIYICIPKQYGSIFSVFIFIYVQLYCCVLLCLATFTNIVLNIHPCSCMQLCSFSLLCDIPLFDYIVIYSSVFCYWMCDGLSFLPIMNNAFIDISYMSYTQVAHATPRESLIFIKLS